MENAFQAELGRPLNCDFWLFPRIILPIWGTYTGYATGAVVRFSLGNQSGPGIYVHIGTYQTFNSIDEPTNAERMRGYVGAAAAIWSSSCRVVSANKIVDAEEAIVEAETEGRTKELEGAKHLLDEARLCYQLGEFQTAVEWARYSEITANQALNPSFVETYGYHVVAIFITGAVIASALTIRWKRNSKKRKSRSEGY